MRVSLRWLGEYIDLPEVPPARIAQALASLGHEVESVEEREAAWSGVVVARVEEVATHPEARKVRLCKVSTGGDPVDVWCGAWNFEAGATVAYAPPGAVLAGGMEIGVKPMFGVASQGMICSERELGLGDDHSGILVLDADVPLGTDLASWVELPDVILELGITPNRPDAMSMVGIARELGAFFGVPHRRPDSTVPSVPGRPSVDVEIEDRLGCRRFTLRELRGVGWAASPFWMRRRLRAAGIRPISNIVDVTNYVMLELGHPLHAFDADRIEGDRLVVRRAKAGETLVTLDEVRRELGEDDLVICDDLGPTSLAGTMGGARSEVGETTGRVLLEAASWDPPTVMWMARRHALRSEASARFERGVDPGLPLEASARAARLLLETAGGTLLADVVDEVAVPPEPNVIRLPVSEVVRTLGAGFTSEEIGAALSSIELGVEGDDPLTVTVPTFRPDLKRPIDLVEEVARLRGFDWFGESVPTGLGGGWTRAQQRVRQVRAVLAGAGLSQAVNLSFMGVEDLEVLGFPEGHEGRRVVGVANPLRDEESALRTSLLPGLLRALRHNVAHGTESVALFETGRVFLHRPGPEDPRIPDQPDRLAFALVGSFGGRDLAGRARPVDVYTATALWRHLAEALHLEDWELRPAEAPGFHPGRAAEVVVDGSGIGVVGEAHPRTAASYELPGRVALAELDLAALARPRPLPQLSPPSPYPPVEFDLAFLVGRGVPASELLRVTQAAGGELVEAARVFDEYVGVGEERKSLAIRYVLRASDRTLTSEEVAPVRRAMAEAASGLGAELRGRL